MHATQLAQLQEQQIADDVVEYIAKANEHVGELDGDRADIVLRIDGVTKTFVKTAKSTKAASGTSSALWKRLIPSRELKRVVDDVTLHVRDGEVMGVLDPNGCGKSTLVRMVATLLTPDTGAIEVFGYDVTRDQRAVKQIINRVPDDAAFFKKPSAMENSFYSAQLYSVLPTVGLKRAREILALLGFDEENLGSPMEQLSRGQQQKVAIARAFLIVAEAASARRADDGTRSAKQEGHRGDYNGAFESITALRFC